MVGVAFALEMLLVEREKVTDLNISVAEGMKMVISGGAVLPSREKRN